MCDAVSHLEILRCAQDDVLGLLWRDDSHSRLEAPSSTLMPKRDR